MAESTDRNRDFGTQGAAGGFEAGGDVAGGGASGLGDRAHDAADTAGEMGERARGQARAASERFKNSASHLREQAKEQASQLGGKLRERGEETVERARQQAVDQVSHFGEAIRSAAGKLHEQEHGGVACYVESLADQVDRAANYMRDADVREVLGGVQSFARRRPELVLGGMFLAGIAAARFLKASADREASQRYGSGYGSEAMGYERELGGTYGDYDAASSETAFDGRGAGGVGSPMGAQPIGTSVAFGETTATGVTTDNPTGATGASAMPTTGNEPAVGNAGASCPTPQDRPGSMNP